MYFSSIIMSRSHMKKAGKKIKVRVGKTCEITHLVEVLYHLRHHDARSCQGASLGIPEGFLGAS